MYKFLHGLTLGYLCKRFNGIYLSEILDLVLNLLLSKYQPKNNLPTGSLQECYTRTGPLRILGLSFLIYFLC